jgi:hypothetical protein
VAFQTRFLSVLHRRVLLTIMRRFVELRLAICSRSGKFFNSYNPVCSILNVLSLLRAQQDEEYQRALAIDRAKTQERRRQESEQTPAESEIRHRGASVKASAPSFNDLLNDAGLLLTH